MPKPAIIQTIESAAGCTLTEQPDLSKLKKYDFPKTYALDAKGQVIGLNLRGAGLKSFDFWAELPHLQALNLSENQLTEIDFPSSLAELWFVNLSENPELHNITFAAGLPKLQEFNGSECKLTSIQFPPGFNALQTVDLSRNALEQVTFKTECRALKFLNLGDNQLKEFLLPQGSSFNILQEVQLRNNPLSSSFEATLKQGNDAFIRFLRQLAGQGIQESYEIKVLIVGEGETGKTTLWKFLQDPDHVPDARQESTVGIVIKEGWAFKHLDHPEIPFSVNLWDFGGQEIQYMTHQFFLTRRSFYVLLADGRRELANFSYWFKAIHLLGCDPDSLEKLPVLVVLNEKGNPIAKMPYDPGTVAVDFPRLEVQKTEVDFGKKDARLKNLPNVIQEILCRRFSHLPLKVPTRWGDVRRELQRLRNTERKNHIDAAEWTAICRAHGIDDDEQRRDMSRLFHDLGIILHYQDVRFLHDFIILNPEWAVKAVYELLRHPEVKDVKQGRFDLQLLTKIWTACGYTPKEQDGLLSLMLKDGFEVCFRAREGGKDIYIAPQLLPEFQPGLDWMPEQVVLRFTYQYAFMPKGIIGRLIVRLHEHLESHDDQKVIWEKGMILAKDNCRALVQETDEVDTGLKLIKIEIIGRTRDDCKYVLRDICKQLDSLHRESFPSLRIEKKIPCNCAVCRDSVSPHFYNLSELEDRKTNDKKTIECKIRPYENVSIENLLEGITPGDHKMPVVEKSTNRKKVFFSYSKKDSQYLAELLVHLSGLKRSGKVEPWHDRDVKPGEEWDVAIRRELSAADIIVLFISPDFLATDYIWEVEITEAMQRHERGEARVIPVFVRPCDWADMPFGKLNGLPSKAKPITEYDNRDKAWLEVVEGIKKVID